MARAVPAPMRKLRRRCRQAPVTVDTANFKTVAEALARDALRGSTEEFVGIGAEQGTLLSFQIEFQSVTNPFIYRSSLSSHHTIRAIPLFLGTTRRLIYTICRILSTSVRFHLPRYSWSESYMTLYP